jgi:hypothetical protein
MRAANDAVARAAGVKDLFYSLERDDASWTRPNRLLACFVLTTHEQFTAADGWSTKTSHKLFKFSDLTEGLASIETRIH